MSPQPAPLFHHWLWSSMLRYRGIYIRVFAAAALINLMSVASSIFIMVVYDRVVPNAAFQSLYALTLGMLIIILFDFILKTLRAWFIDYAGQYLDQEVGENIFASLLAAPLKKVAGPVGALANTLREFELVRDFFTSAPLALVVDIPFIFLFLLVIYLIAGPVAVIPLLAVPLVLGVGFGIQPALARLAARLAEHGQGKQAVLVESIAGLESIKGIGGGDMFRRRWRGMSSQAAPTNRLSKVLSQLAVHAAASAQQLSMVGIVFYAVFLINSGELSMGAMVAAVLLSSRALAPLAQIANLLARLNGARTAYRKIDDLMREFDASAPDPGTVLITPEQLGTLEMRKVNFSYQQASPPAVEDLSLTLAQGEHIAILGRNGSGKTTLAKLAVGLFHPDAGVVMYNGLNLEQIAPQTLQNNLGIILQEVHLFSGSIRDNILMDRDISEEDLARTVELSGLGDFLPFIPGGLNAILADRGASLSAGQRQTIAIARGLARDPSHLVMDEPTSAMDLNAEQALVRRLQQYLHNRTMLLITHRLPLLELVERVAVMEDGRLTMDGPKEQVLEQLRARSN